MKSKLIYIHVLVCLFLGVATSCVNDDSIFPDETEGTITPSISLVSYLDFIKNSDAPETQLCFQFVYPISLGLSANDSRVTIENYDALQNAISNQSLNFNIEGIAYPFQIIERGSATPVTIENEDVFLNVLRECEIPNFREDFEAYQNNCFELKYPVVLFSEAGDRTDIASDEALSQFLASQPETYQPLFEFPIRVTQLNTQEVVEVTSYFGFYRLIEACTAGCPSELSFTVERTNPEVLGYRFEAILPQDFTEAYDWFVGDRVIERDGPAVDGDNILEFEFDTPGTYFVCIKYQSPTCTQEIPFCQQIVVEEFCPIMEFTFEQEPGTTSYTFVADFEFIDRINYEWSVDDVVIATGGQNGNNTILQDLAPGLHNVCIKYENNTCPQGTGFCREIRVEPICPDLFFIAEQDGTNPAYNFFADFAGMNDITYNWTINGEFIETDGGPDGDNTLFFQFNPGTYQVCITTETPDCPNGVQFCEEIVIN
ncbi:hypothetical protein [Aquimarina brevivitae]|uniref:PKD domain-containing protein n=1 Tax=Aquimarina brevivitae TaxID=323412 RepID=A0A4V2F5L7_9FLAO|nr:hypothetical protein [Aquimarina brevivitae]RZS93259.1 hypothetical protein EV197_1835 [Aquimarina brevivitae]